MTKRIDLFFAINGFPRIYIFAIQSRNTAGRELWQKFDSSCPLVSVVFKIL